MHIYKIRGVNIGEFKTIFTEGIYNRVSCVFGIYIALFFTRLKRLTVYPDVEYLLNFGMIFALAIIGIIAGTLIGFVRFKIESRYNSR
ncbi:hypothetical protein [Clostridium sp.]|uniref:hypothetical protein n=1 Tax=Clostridium sp. TaxID=1506 RepID=UPI003217B26D